MSTLDPGSGMKKTDPGSGINIPDSKHFVHPSMEEDGEVASFISLSSGTEASVQYSVSPDRDNVDYGIGLSYRPVIQ